jgi:hypothetical protein
LESRHSPLDAPTHSQAQRFSSSTARFTPNTVRVQKKVSSPSVLARVPPALKTKVVINGTTPKKAARSPNNSLPKRKASQNVPLTAKTEISRTVHSAVPSTDVMRAIDQAISGGCSG